MSFLALSLIYCAVWGGDTYKRIIFSNTKTHIKNKHVKRRIKNFTLSKRLLVLYYFMLVDFVKPQPDATIILNMQIRTQKRKSKILLQQIDF